MKVMPVFQTLYVVFVEVRSDLSQFIFVLFVFCVLFSLR